MSSSHSRERLGRRRVHLAGQSPGNKRREAWLVSHCFLGRTRRSPPRFTASWSKCSYHRGPTPLPSAHPRVFSPFSALLDPPSSSLLSCELRSFLRCWDFPSL